MGDEEKEGPEEAFKLDEFEVLAEWTFRRLRKPSEEPRETYPRRVLQWILCSLGLEKKTQDIYFYIREREGVTTTEVAEDFSMGINTARRHLDQLHTLGLIDYLGREYRPTYDSIAKAIDLMLLPRITDLLRTISRTASTIERSPRSVEDSVQQIQRHYAEVQERMSKMGIVFPEFPKIEFPPSASSPQTENVNTIQHLPSLVITSDNLRQSGAKLDVKHIGLVEFTPDVTKEDIENHIARLKFVRKLVIPENAYPGLFGRIHHVTEIKRY